MTATGFPFGTPVHIDLTGSPVIITMFWAVMSCLGWISGWTLGQIV